MFPTLKPSKGTAAGVFPTCRNFKMGSKLPEFSGMSWQICEDRLPIVIYTGHTIVLPARFERFVPWDMTIKGTSVSPTLSVDLMLSSTLLSWSISAYLRLTPPARNVQFRTKPFQWRIAGEATQRGENEMLSIGCLPYQPSHAFDDISTAVFDRALVIIIPCHIFWECVVQTCREPDYTAC